MASITDEKSAIKDGYRLIPKQFSLEAYEYLIKKIDMFGKGYAITIAVTVIGVIACIFITLLITVCYGFI